ncbi:MAG: branched-chain amino acid ABC transporter permease [Dehalococcoidia bacterium]|nr:MAG: branched-chain amino acid ABC transporter permease [Dehalococcoidia bacterium]
MFEQILINGAMLGGIYAVLALGFSLIFGVARIINLAHTAFYMLAAYAIYTFAHLLGLSAIPSIALSIVLTTLIGIGTYKLFIDRVREHETPVLMITIALALVFQECMLLAFGGHFLGAPSFVSGYVELLGVRISNQHLLTFGVVLACLLGIWVLLTKSKLGIAIRSVAQDREIANLMGINVGRICLMTMAIAVAMAAISGAMVAPIFVLDPRMWMHPLIMGLAIVVLGGLGSLKGSFAGAFILAYTETLVVFLVPVGSFIKGAVALAVMVAVLLIRPEGLFGLAFEEERL